jgi:hypothetical protein
MASALPVVLGPHPGRGIQRSERLRHQRIDQPVMVDEPRRLSRPAGGGTVFSPGLEVQETRVLTRRPATSGVCRMACSQN